tara:strand:+ start:7149 stop:7349 length:201 start_codon:yes stop_codon:yes gene_type:complete
MSNVNYNNQERELWLDVAKGVGICLVVAYHTCEGILNSFQNNIEVIQAVNNFLRSWLMPMFFMVSV